MIRTRSLTILMAAALACTTTNVCAANIILNGSFEDPVLTPGEALDVNGPGNGGTGAGIPDWTVVGNQINVIQTLYSEPNNGMVQFNAQDGHNALDLTGSFNSGPTDGIMQTAATTPGHMYDLSFYVGRAQSNNGASQYQDPSSVGVSINGGSQISFTNSNGAPSGFIGWEQFTESFTATTSSTTIAFYNDTPLNTYYAGLDNVVLTDAGAATPEPAGLALLSIGVAIVGASGSALRRRK